MTPARFPVRRAQPLAFMGVRPEPRRRATRKPAAPPTEEQLQEQRVSRAWRCGALYSTKRWVRRCAPRFRIVHVRGLEAEREIAVCQAFYRGYDAATRARNASKGAFFQAAAICSERSMVEQEQPSPSAPVFADIADIAAVLARLRAGDTLRQEGGRWFLGQEQAEVCPHAVAALRAGGSRSEPLAGLLLPLGDRLPGFDVRFSQTWSWVEGQAAGARA